MNSRFTSETPWKKLRLLPIKFYHLFNLFQAQADIGLPTLTCFLALMHGMTVILERVQVPEKVLLCLCKVGVNCTDVTVLDATLLRFVSRITSIIVIDEEGNLRHEA